MTDTTQGQDASSGTSSATSTAASTDTLAAPATAPTAPAADHPDVDELFPKQDVDELFPVNYKPPTTLFPGKTPLTGGSSAIADQVFSRPDRIEAHVLSAFGYGFKQGWGSTAPEFSEANEALRQYGVYNDYAKGQHSIIKAANETLMRPAVAAIVAGHGLMAGAYLGTRETLYQIGRELGSENLGRTLSEIPEAFPTGIHQPMGVPRLPEPPRLTAAQEAAARTERVLDADVARQNQGLVPHVMEKIQQARELGVIGSGEDGYFGTKPVVDSLFPGKTPQEQAAAKALAEPSKVTEKDWNETILGQKPAGEVPSPVVQAAPMAGADAAHGQDIAAEPAAGPVEPTAAAPQAPVVQSIVDDVKKNLMAAGRPEAEAEAAAQIIASHYRARAERFQGAKGTPEELYAAEGPIIQRGAGVQPVKPAEAAQQQLSLTEVKEETAAPPPKVIADAAPADRASLEKLVKSGAPAEEIANHPIVRGAQDENRARPQTKDLPGYGTDEFKANREFNFDGEKVKGYDAATERLTEGAKAFSTKGPVKNEREATIILGPPASGKSRLSETYARERNAAIVDSDEAKKVIPEYDNGAGTSAVHEESGDLMFHPGGVLERLVREGSNLVLPKVGHSVDSIREIIDGLKAQGYRINLVNMSVEPAEAYRRMIGRFMKTGRVIGSDYFNSIDHKPTATYNTLKNEAGLLHEAANIDVNGKPGEERFIDGEGTSLERDLRSGREREPQDNRNAAEPAEAEAEAQGVGLFRGAEPGTPLELRPEEADSAHLISLANDIAGEWQDKLGSNIKVTMGGSLVSHTYVRAGNEPIDMDIRFLTDNPERDYPKVEEVTGLKLRKSIDVDNIDGTQSKAFMVEGPLTRDGITFDVEAAVRTPSYVGWARFYPKVMTADELAAFRGDKARLKGSKKEYKALKSAMLTEVRRRVEALGGPDKIDHVEPAAAATIAADHIDSLSPTEQKRELPAYSPAAERAAPAPDQPAGVFMFNPTALNVDAKRFQFKSGGDEYGVTGALRNVTKWDPAKAQAIIVWEQNDGKLFVADGHQRAGLARRLTEQGKAKDIQLPGILYREKDGMSADDIRAVAAVTNIANGSGSALDGAKVLRARPDLMDGSLPLSVGKGKQAAALARLGDEPFRMVVNDVVPEHYGAVVGELIPHDPVRQEAALKAIARFEPKNADEAAVLTQRVAQAELEKQEAGRQTSMFGDLETPESTAGEEMKIVGRAIADLKKDKSLFARVLANAERIEQTGSSIAREAAQGVTSDAEIFAKTLTSEAYSAGPLRTELIAAAKDLKSGKIGIGDATSRILAALRRQAETHGADRAGAVAVQPETEREFAQRDEGGPEFDLDAELVKAEQRHKQAEDLVKSALAMDKPKLVLANGDHKILLSPGFGDSPYRITSFDKQGPHGHRDYGPNDLRWMTQEVASAMAGGYEVVERPPAIAARAPAGNLFEPGAEGKPQALIPGVKPVTQRDLIQAAANKPMAPKGKKPQKPVGSLGGLFGDSMDQKELFQRDFPGGKPVTPRMSESYELGKKVRQARDEWRASKSPLGSFDHDFAYGHIKGLTEADAEKIANMGPVASAFYESGLRDLPMPTYTTGQRYGAAPADGRSWNYREAEFEPGVSMARVDHPDFKDYEWADIGNNKNRPIGNYEGWLLPFKGSDDEPLMVGLKPNDELAQTAWHASPYHFDTFDTGKIGTGEGAASYGHGLYFAEHPDVGKEYQRALTAGRESHADARHYLEQAGGDHERAIELMKEARGAELRRTIETNERAIARLKAQALTTREERKEAADRIVHWEKQSAAARRELPDPQLDPATVAALKAPNGVLYRVDIKPEPQEFLQWDKPLSEQPQAIRDAIEKATPKPGWLARQWEGEDAIRHEIATSPESTGAQAYGAMAKILGSQKAATDALREAGLPGIRYLDQFSRTEGQGTHNYVVFDPKHIQILDRNGEPVSQREFEFNQIKRGSIRLREDAKPIIKLFADANASTFLHETGHQWLEELMGDARDERAPADLKADADTVLKWLGVDKAEDIKTRHHEQFARGFETYMMEGRAPTPDLASVFARFKDWLTRIYRTVARLNSPISDEVRGVFDRLIVHNPEPHSTEVPSFADLHEADAASAPHEAAREAANTIASERDLIANRAMPEEHDARLENVAGRDERHPAGGAQSDDHGNAAGAGPGEKSTPVANGTVSPSGTAAAPQGAGTRESAGGEQPVNATEPFRLSETPWTDKAGNIRLENINAPDDVKQVLRDAANRNNGFLAERRGVITDAEALALSQALGEDPAFLDRKAIGTAYTKEEIFALEHLLIQSATAVRDAMAKGDEVAYAEVKARHMMIHDMVQAKASAARAEAGRALQAFAAMKRMPGAKDAAALQDWLKVNTGKTLFQLQEEMRFGSKLSTPAQVSQFLNDSFKKNFHDAVIYYYVNALISGPITHFRYSIGNAINAIWKPLVELPTAALIGAAKEAAGVQSASRVYLGEAGAQLFAITKGSRDGLTAAIKAFQDGVSPPLAAEQVSAHFGEVRQPIPGPAGTVIGIPGRSVAAIHSFFKQLRYEQEIQGQAYRQATREGLQGEAFHGRIADLTTRPTAEMMEAATRESLKELFMAPTDYHSFMGMLTRATNSNLIAKIMVPFMKIGSQITRNAFIERTPLGLASRDVRATLADGGAGADIQAAKMATGVALMGATVLLAAEGMATGDGPTDPAARSVWLLNHRPNSVVIGGVSMPYQGLGHLGMLMRFSANMYETAHYWDGEDGGKLATSFFEGLTKSVMDENFMRGVKDMLDAVYHPEEYGASYIRNNLTNWIPFSVGFGQVAREIDPYQREAHSIFDAARAKIPIASEGLFPRRDRFGEPIPNGAPLPQYQNDPVVQQMERLHLGIAPVPKKIRNVELTPQQYDDFSRIAGRMVKMQLNAFINTPGINQLPDELQRQKIHEIVEHAREAARGIVMMQNPQILEDAREKKIAPLLKAPTLTP